MLRAIIRLSVSALIMAALQSCVDKDAVAAHEAKINELESELAEIDEKSAALNDEYDAALDKQFELKVALEKVEASEFSEVSRQEIQNLEKEVSEISDENSKIQQELEKL